MASSSSEASRAAVSQIDDTPRPRYYARRGDENGPAIALIPVDELPFDLPHVSKVLTSDEISDSGMQYVGNIEGPLRSTTIHKLADATSCGCASTSSNRYPDRISDHRCCSSQEVVDLDLSTERTSLSSTRQRKREENYPAKNAAHPLLVLPTRNNASTYVRGERGSFYFKVSADIDDVLARLGLRPRNAPSKLYCTFWTNPGWCKYEQTAGGCAFRHEAPPVEDLRKLLASEHYMPPSWRYPIIKAIEADDKSRQGSNHTSAARELSRVRSHPAHRRKAREVNEWLDQFEAAEGQRDALASNPEGSYGAHARDAQRDKVQGDDGTEQPATAVEIEVKPNVMVQEREDLIDLS